MIEYYSKIIEQHGGEMNGHWNFALCLAFPDGKMTEAVAISQPRLFTSKVSLNRSPGYPLESLQIDPKTGKYVVEMTEEEVGQFWLESTGEKIRELFAGLEEIKTDTAE